MAIFGYLLGLMIKGEEPTCQRGISPVRNPLKILLGFFDKHKL
jgi:hypothetical protein